MGFRNSATGPDLGFYAACACREPCPRHATRRYSLIMPLMRACLRTWYRSRSTCRCRKPVPPGRMLCWPLVTRPRVRHMRVRSWPAGAWDDLRLVGLKLIFLIVTRAMSLLGMSRREWRWKDAEILMLRHQLAVAERERPRAHSGLAWPDRAWLALLAGTVPAERLAAMRPSSRPLASGSSAPRSRRRE